MLQMHVNSITLTLQALQRCVIPSLGHAIDLMFDVRRNRVRVGAVVLTWLQQICFAT